MLSPRHFSLLRRYFGTSLSHQAENVGIIGLGNMGSGMAKNLVQKGYNVTAYDVSPSALETFQKLGGSIGSSPSEVATKSQVIFTMLPNNEIVEEVYITGPNSISDTLLPNSICIDCSTIDPALSQKLQASLKNLNGTMFADAPVSGGVLAAAAGTLTILAGAENEINFEKIKPYLEVVGAKVIHCGPVGSGQVAKLCNNMLLGISMIGTSEAMNLGKNLGMDSKKLAEILSSSTGRCWSVDSYNPVPGVLKEVPSSKGYEGGFGAALMMKDLKLCQDAAARTGSTTLLGSMAHEVYRLIVNSGHGNKDFGYAYQFLQKTNDKK